jgi:AmmeMemoRadiSam system protein B
MSKTMEVRPSPIAGQWYPADPRRLATQVDQYMDAAELPELGGEVMAVMAPHAGHLYSGPVAGYAFAALRGLNPDLVVVVSPMHYPYDEPLLTTAHAAYATPLGTIPVERQALLTLDGYLRQSLGYGLAAVAHDPEHSLEIELPFLQRALAGPFSLLPIMVREQDERTAKALGQALARLILESPELAGKNALLVASTDLSHFYPQTVAVQLDGAMLRQVEAFDPGGVIRVEEEGKGFACGRGALAAVLWAAKGLGADRAQVLRHATSGDVTGDYDRVVGYGAAVFTRQRRN